MRKIRVKEIEEGMVLAQNIEDSVGRTLLNRGDTLRQAFIKKLDSWGVNEIIVEGSQEEEIEKLKAASVVSAEEIETDIDACLDRKFSAVAGKPLMDELKLLAKKHLMRLALTGSGQGGPIRWK